MNIDREEIMVARRPQIFHGIGGTVTVERKTRSSRRVPNALKPPDINPNGQSQKIIPRSITKLREEFVVDSKANGAIEARRLLDFVLHVSENSQYKVPEDSLEACVMFAPRCGLEPKQQERALKAIRIKLGRH